MINKNNKSYIELLDPSKEGDRSKKVEFLKNNGVNFYVGMHPLEIDYDLFVGCMEIYENTGVDYFQYYKRIRLFNQYRTVSEGVRNYVGSFDYYVEDKTNIKYLYNYKKEIIETIQILEFFGLSGIYGKTIDEYINDLNNADEEWKQMRDEELAKIEKTAKEKSDKLKTNYYNFDDFNDDKFNKIFKECIKDMDMGKNTYTLEEVININVNLEENKTFIVFLRKDDRVCFVGRTTRLLTYIGTKSKEYDADRVAFYPVDNDYIDDIYIKALIEFDIIGGTVKNTNRKYISMTSVKRIFKELYRINLTHIKKIISKYDIEKYVLGDIIILDKIELDRATRDYLNLE